VTRRQLPAYSPLDLRSLGKACLDAVTGPEGARSRLSSWLALRYPCERVVLTGSGTQALELALRLGLETGRPGAPVALPAYSCFDVVTAAAGAGAPILFYDVDPETLAPDMESLRDALAGGAGTVVVSSLYGFPVDWDAVMAACAESGAVLIEDAAQGLGSTWWGREGGTFGDLSVLSFGRGKGWAGGGGGALLIRDQGERAAGLLSTRVLPAPRGAGIRAAALSLTQWGIGRPSLYALPAALPWLGLGETAYKEPIQPRAMASFSAALAAASAEAAAAEVATRRQNAAEILGLLGPDGVTDYARPARPLEGGEAGYLRLPVRCTEASRSALESREARTLGIARGYPRPLPELPAAKGLSRESPGPVPGACQLSESLFTLPTHSLLNPRDLARMAWFFDSLGRAGA
jgi:perosamine synthetase